MKTCHCQPGKDYIGIGAGALILNADESKTLLLLRGKNAKNEPGTWSRPGGTIEYGETIEECLHREVLEEIGVEITDLEYTNIVDHFLPEKNEHWIALGYKAKIAPGQTPRNMEPHKCDGVRWFGKDELPINIYGATREAIEMWRDKK